MTDFVLALTTWPDEAGAKGFAQRLLEKRLAACVNLLPAMQSFYVWKGEFCSGNEHQLIIKTRRDHIDALEAELNAAHPYELAEFLVLPIESGSKGFLTWINESTHAE